MKSITHTSVHWGSCLVAGTLLIQSLAAYDLPPDHPNYAPGVPWNFVAAPLRENTFFYNDYNRYSYKYTNGQLFTTVYHGGLNPAPAERDNFSGEPLIGKERFPGLLSYPVDNPRFPVTNVLKYTRASVIPPENEYDPPVEITVPGEGFPDGLNDIPHRLSTLQGNSVLWFAAQLNKDGWIAFPVSTAGYSDILLTFDFRVVNMTSSANYVFEFSPDNGETWTYQIFSYGDLNVIAWDQLAFDLKDHPEFNDKPDFIFRVRSIPNLNGDYERFDLSPSTVGTTLQFDRVALSGTPLPPAESTPQESWRETHFGTTANEGDAADTADPEGDGLPNLLEYALGLDPLQSDSAGAVSIGKTGDGQRLALTFTRIADPALTYTVEATDDLVSGEWTPVFTSTDTENTAGSYTAEDADLISAHARRFLRLVVSTEEGDVRSTPRGYVKYDLLSESDTFVALPVERSLVFQGKISSVLGNTIILDGDPDFIPASLRYSEGVQENTYYLQILSGTAAGYYSTVIDNGADDITAEFSPDIISRIQPGDAIAIRPYWTLGTLLPSADAGQSFIASTNNLSSGRRTEILFPDLLSQGINKSVESTYFFNSYWRKVGDISPDRGDAAIPPDGYIIISGTNYAQDTSLLVLGEVPTGPRVIPLVTVSGQQNDNLAGLNVPVDLTLDQLNLVGSDRPFTVSTNNLQSGRGDELTVFDNSQRAKNKSGSDTYFYNGYWRKVGSVTEDQGSLKLPAGSAIVIRKKAGVATAIDDWLLDTTPLWQQHE